MLHKKLERNKRGYVTFRGLYQYVKDDYLKEYNDKKKRYGNSKRPKYVNTIFDRFRVIAYCYLKYCLYDTINGLIGVEWYPKFGRLQVVSFVSGVSSYTIRTIDGAQKRVHFDKEPYNGMFSYLLWKNNKLGKMYKYKVKLSRPFKRLIGKHMKEGKEYLTLEKGYKHKL